jgi:hypothetical protein
MSVSTSGNEPRTQSYRLWIFPAGKATDAVLAILVLSVISLISAVAQIRTWENNAPNSSLWMKEAPKNQIATYQANPSRIMTSEEDLEHVSDAKEQPTQLSLPAAASSPQGSQNEVLSKNPPLIDTKSSAFKAQVSSSIGWSKWCENNMKPGYDLAPLADKHGVKKWIQTVVPDLKIAREYAYVDHAQNITTELLESLPESYMMKATHMSGGILMVNGDKVKCLRTPCSLQRVKENESNLAYMQRMCGLFLKNSYGEQKREMWYSRVERRCIFEELLPLALGRGFQDFKIHMYHNRPMFIQINTDRFSSPTRNSLTPDWQELPWKADLGGADVGERPAFLDNMLSDATTMFKAANEMVKVDHIRVDFFAFNNTYYFSEMTFAHGSCGLYFKEPMANKFYGFVASHPDLLIPPNAILDLYEAPGSNVTLVK